MLQNKILKFLKKDLMRYNAPYILLLLICIWVSEWSLFKTSDQPEQISKTADTLIPLGHVLIPIDILNSENLDSLLGNHGVVDLYFHQKHKNILVARRLKILRAPLNPNHYAVLVKESKAQQILKYTGPFIVSLQNPKTHGTKIVKQKAKKFSRILKEDL